VQKRVASFLKSLKTEHDKQVLFNRGLQICGIGNEKQNLGNMLFISDKYLKDLNPDRNQSSPPFNLTLPLHGALSTVSFLGNPRSSSALAIFTQATRMVHDSFREKMIEMELFKDLGTDFTVDALILNDQVIACVEYVFMKKYVWIECLAVTKQMQRTKFGTLLINRIIDVAKYRRKDVLVYSLADVVGFYVQKGFVDFGGGGPEGSFLVLKVV
jgi:GNAT superfamily N-acetyltransferase